MLPLINNAISWALFGLIWVSQIVTYPGFQDIGKNAFQAYHQNYMTAITYVVMPLMLSELALSAWLTWQSNFSWSYLFPLLIVAGIWASTFFIQVPLHNALVEGKDTVAIRQLVNSNWIRTIAWTLKAVWLTWFLVK